MHGCRAVHVSAKHESVLRPQRNQDGRPRRRSCERGVTPMTKTDFAMLGRIGAYRLHALHDARETTAAARATSTTRGPRKAATTQTRADRHDVVMDDGRLRLPSPNERRDGRVPSGKQQVVHRGH